MASPQKPHPRSPRSNPSAHIPHQYLLQSRHLHLHDDSHKLPRATNLGRNLLPRLLPRPQPPPHRSCLGRMAHPSNLRLNIHGLQHLFLPTSRTPDKNGLQPDNGPIRYWYYWYPRIVVLDWLFRPSNHLSWWEWDIIPPPPLGGIHRPSSRIQPPLPLGNRFFPPRLHIHL